MATRIGIALERSHDFWRSTIGPMCQNFAHEVSHACSECTGRLQRMSSSNDGTISKLLSASAICNVLLFTSALFLWGHPTMGFGIGLTSWLSMFQILLLWLTVKKSPALSNIMERFSSQFLLGSFAGGTLVLCAMLLNSSVYLSSAAGMCTSLSSSSTTPDAVGAHVAGATAGSPSDYECYSSHHFAMRMSSFFSGVLVIINGALTMLLFSRNEDLGLEQWSSHQYNPIGGETPGGNPSHDPNLNGYHSTPSVP